MSYQRRIFLLALLTGLPAAVLALLLIWNGDLDQRLRWTLTGLLLASWLGLATVLRERLIRPLQTAANALAAIKVGDYSLRLRGSATDDGFGLLALEINQLGAALRGERLEELEAGALLERVMEEIDVAVFAFDEDRRLRLVNRAGERLLNGSGRALLGRSARSLGLSAPLEARGSEVMDLVFPGGSGRWEIRRRDFRQKGRPHQLLVLSDLSRVLREEERTAWQRLVRVLSHEINNSLAPIRSIAESLRGHVTRDPDHDRYPEELEQGLTVIAGRSEALGRFMSSYARLARLPKPRLAPVDVEGWVERVANLETRLPVLVEPGPPITVLADGDQLDQLLINLIDNAVDAARETGGGVGVGWKFDGAAVEVSVVDDGPGIGGTANLFVPFFTTKAEGSGIGLALSRQIVEAHGGTLSLENRDGNGGCVATIRLPAGRE
ncbi:MAG: sensor histidine kinase [Gemmatimonadota bacterium]